MTVKIYTTVYTYSCSGFILKKCVCLNLVIGPSRFPKLWKSVQVTDPFNQHQQIRHLAQNPQHKTFKSDDKYSSFRWKIVRQLMTDV